MRKQPGQDADMQDAITDWRRFLTWRPGERKRIKRRANKAVRRSEREVIEEWL